MVTLERTLGLPALCFYAIGMILGAGIYSVIGEAAGLAGHALWLSFALGAAIALLTGLAYAELATMFPRAGAEYLYLREAVPRWRWAATVVGVLLVFSSAATAATVSLAFAGYLSRFVELPAQPVALALLGVFTAVNIVGIRQSTWVAIAFTIVELGGLVLVIGLGLRHPELGHQALAAIGAGVLPGAALVFFAFLGFEEIANLAEEARAPERNLPRAILIGVVVTTVIYVLVALSVTALLDPRALAASPAPLAAAVSEASPRLAGVLGGVALFATANTGLIALVTKSRLLLGMARTGALPPALLRVVSGRQTPWVAALVMLAVAAALVPAGGVAVVASLSSFGALVAFVSVNACVIVLRFAQPDRARPFRVPVTIGRFPLLPAVGIAAALGLLTQFEARVYLGGAVAIALGLAVHVVGGRLWRAR